MAEIRIFNVSAFFPKKAIKFEVFQNETLDDFKRRIMHHFTIRDEIEVHSKLNGRVSLLTNDNFRWVRSNADIFFKFPKPLKVVILRVWSVTGEDIIMKDRDSLYVGEKYILSIENIPSYGYNFAERLVIKSLNETKLELGVFELNIDAKTAIIPFTSRFDINEKKQGAEQYTGKLYVCLTTFKCDVICWIQSVEVTIRRNYDSFRILSIDPPILKKGKDKTIDLLVTVNKNRDVIINDEIDGEGIVEFLLGIPIPDCGNQPFVTQPYCTYFLKSNRKELDIRIFMTIIE